MSRSHHHHHKKRKKGPPLFSEIGKEAKGLLIKGYNYNQLLSITSTKGGVALTSSVACKKEHSTGAVATKCRYKNTTIDVNVNTHSTGAVAAQYKYKDTTIDVNVNTRSNISAVLTFRDSLPSTDIIASYNFPNFHELVVKHLNEHATFAMSMTLNKFPAIKLSATIGTPKIAFGVEGKYSIASSRFTEYNAGFGVTKSNMDASIILADKGDLITISYLQYLNWHKRIAAGVEVNRRFSNNKNTFTVGGSCIVDHLTKVKARLNNCGKLETAFEHEIRPKSYLTVSGEFDTKALNNIPRIGLAVALKL